ncbi:hypothetical protein RHMOL_Rhmol03G0214200 [Rhododendron molle]|uniref:Uncharacterized protein n=1 Tax=Rhododendron molle TaxID=49168 RepID=A0ACC0PI89_RHOML|nr:hypothetical protein RHMOL_Rhmol03G0214200 [Rhododendron molle]
MDAGNNDTHTHVLDFNGFCNLCDKHMRSTKAVVGHQNIVHQGAKIKCTVCGRRFDNKAELSDHMDRPHR